ncbi:hypothetical protein BGZ49_008414 [Haplosporangium sp. Z 27]|nr:hypothetical protein BGZ49_008414 [Haplosporangium sp. Z 27]
MSEVRTRALLRLVEFGRAFVFSSENDTILYWKSLTARFYGNTGRLRYSVRNPDTGDIKAFELATPTISHFYLANAKSGVSEVQLIWEENLGQTGSFPLTVECSSISLVSTYRDGAKVISKGRVKATFTNDFQFDLLELTMCDFNEYITRLDEETSTSPDVKTESKKKTNSKQVASLKKQSQSIPERVLNEFGVPHDTMRMLEVTDNCSKMNILLQYSVMHKIGAAEALAAVAQEVRELASGAKQQNQVNNLAASISPLPTYSTSHVASSNDEMLMRASASPRSIKRRTSIAISPNELGHIASPNASPTMDELQSATSGTGTPALNPAAIPGTNLTKGISTGLGLSFSGSSTQASSSITSPIFSSSNIISGPLAAVSPGSKSSKRVRTASMTPTLVVAGSNGNKGSAGVNTVGQVGKLRKGSGRKDNTKRKVSQAEDVGIDTITPGAMVAGPPELIPGSVGRNGMGTSSLIMGTGEQTSNAEASHLSSNHQLPSFESQSNNRQFLQNGTPISATGQGGYQENNVYFTTQQVSILPGQNVSHTGGLDPMAGITSTQMYLNVGNEGQGQIPMNSSIGNPASIQEQIQDHGHWQDHMSG